MKELIPIGIFVIFIGMILVFIGALTSIGESKGETKAAVGGFIGFIPFGFWSDERMKQIVIAFMAVMMFFLVWWFLSR
ncbi:hypothetical protein KY361_03120 [Candidatus Woesearchaeota archaeon]|nr:hypothetical protein [Candidatus Woesearchaeota archaeon]